MPRKLVSELFRWGDLSPWIEKLRLSEKMLAEIGTVAVLAGTVEHHLERAIWSVEKIDPRGIRPSTDTKPVSALIEHFAKSAIVRPELDHSVKAWCEAAAPAFRCRNALFHGVASPLGGMPWFAKDRSWKGEVRKRPFSEFYADEHTLRLLKAAFGVLLRCIVSIEKSASEGIAAANGKEMRSALQEARNVAIELENLAAAVNSEKY